MPLDKDLPLLDGAAEGGGAVNWCVGRLGITGVAGIVEVASASPASSAASARVSRVGFVGFNDVDCCRRLTTFRRSSGLCFCWRTRSSCCWLGACRCRGDCSHRCCARRSRARLLRLRDNA